VIRRISFFSVAANVGIVCTLHFVE
jgi:hypothetical protein